MAICQNKKYQDLELANKAFKKYKCQTDLGSNKILKKKKNEREKTF